MKEEKTLLLASRWQHPDSAGTPRASSTETHEGVALRSHSYPSIPAVAACVRTCFCDDAAAPEGTNLVRVVVSARIERTYGLDAVLHQTCATLRETSANNRLAQGTLVVAEKSSRALFASTRCSALSLAQDEFERVLREEHSRAASGLSATTRLSESRITLETGDGAKLTTTEAVLCGRSQACDLMVSQADVSAHHARIAYDSGGTWTVCDTGSANGTYINGRRTNHDVLREGDTITLASSYTLHVTKIERVA